jgi:hypothetical protein
MWAPTGPLLVRWLPIVTTSADSDCLRAVTGYVVSRGCDTYVGKDIALHNC